MSFVDDKTDDLPTESASQPAGNPGSATETPALPPVEWERIVEVTSVADLFSTHRGNPMARYLRAGDGTIAFKGSSAGVSRRSAAARAGQIFRATTTITVTGEDGDGAPVHFGPVFLNARDEIIHDVRSIPVEARDTEQQVEFEAVAPVGTVSVRLRLVGAWAPDKDTSKVTCTYGPSALYRAKT